MPHPERNFQELAEQLQTIGRQKATGTLRVTASGGLAKLFLFRQGCLADLHTGREDMVLEAAILSTGALQEKDLRRATKNASKSGQSVGSAILDLGVVDEGLIASSIRSQLVNEICEVLQWDLEAIELFEHGADERLEGFQSDLLDYYEVCVESEELVLEAANRIGRWDLVIEHCSMLSDVMYATPSSFRYFREQDVYPNEHAILSRVDGTKDVSEVVSESGLDPFEAILLVRTLQSQGDLELINPVQMYQLGVECLGSGKTEKAAKLFKRARERGLDDFDIVLKLAQSLDSLDRHQEAIQRYIEFADKCSAQEAVEHALPYATRRAELGDARAGLEMLLRVRELAPRDSKVQQKIIELSEACGDHQMARAEREALARTLDERKDVELALETYQKMFCDGNDTLDVRLKLVQLHRQRGNRQKALDHLNAILGLPEKRRVKDEETLVILHETVRDLKPSDIRSNRWLADYYVRHGEKPKALVVLKAWISSLEADGDLAEMVHAYELLIGVSDEVELRWGLARTYEKLGRFPECRRELRNLANLAMQRKEYDQAGKALEHVLKNAPLDLETRKMHADLLEARDEHDLASRRNEEIAILSILSGNIQESEQYCRRLGDKSSELAEAVRRLGRLCLDMGDRQKATEQLIKAAKLHLQTRNFGLCEKSIEQLFQIEPGHPEGKSLLAELKTREAPPPAPPAPEPQAAVAAPAPQAAPPPPAAAPIPQTPQAPTSPALEWPVEREPFQPPKPVVRSNVAGIMARLKKLKTGGDGAPERSAANTSPAPAAPVSPSPVAPSAPVQAEAPSAQAPAEAGAARPDTAAPRAANAALRSAASRLKALAGKKAEKVNSLQEGEAGAGAARDGSPDAASAPTAEASAPTAEPAPRGADQPAPPAAAVAAPEGSAPGSAPVDAVKSLKLGKSASRLASLRKQPAG